MVGHPNGRSGRSSGEKMEHGHVRFDEETIRIQSIGSASAGQSLTAFVLLERQVDPRVAQRAERGVDTVTLHALANIVERDPGIAQKWAVGAANILVHRTLHPVEEVRL